MGAKSPPNYIYKAFRRMKKYFKRVNKTNEIYCYKERLIVKFLHEKGQISAGEY